MKRAAAFILSLTVIWLQLMASAQTLFAAPPPPTEACPCCVAKKVCCCVEESDAQSVPLPVAPASARANIDFTAVLPQWVAWLLPVPAPAKATAARISPDLSSAIPLFRRDCALLI